MKMKVKSEMTMFQTQGDGNTEELLQPHPSMVTEEEEYHIREGYGRNQGSIKENGQLQSPRAGWIACNFLQINVE